MRYPSSEKLEIIGWWNNRICQPNRHCAWTIRAGNTSKGNQQSRSCRFTVRPFQQLSNLLFLRTAYFLTVLYQFDGLTYDIDKGTWCEVEYQGLRGFAAQLYLREDS